MVRRGKTCGHMNERLQFHTIFGKVYNMLSSQSVDMKSNVISENKKSKLKYRFSFCSLKGYLTFVFIHVVTI